MSTANANAAQGRKARQREERVARVLDVTERFAAEAENVEHLSPTLIAELAKVSVGWLYDHVGDRQTVVDMVLLRGLRDMQTTTVMLGLDLARADRNEQIDLLVDTTANFLRLRHGFARLYYSRLAGPGIAELNFQIDQESSRSIAGLPSDSDDPASGEMIATMMTGILDKGLEISFRRDEFRSDIALDETKAAIKAYLDRRLPRTQSANTL